MLEGAPGQLQAGVAAADVAQNARQTAQRAKAARLAAVVTPAPLPPAMYS